MLLVVVRCVIFKDTCRYSFQLNSHHRRLCILGTEGAGRPAMYALLLLTWKLGWGK